MKTTLIIKSAIIFCLAICLGCSKDSIDEKEECTDFYTAFLYDGCSCDGAGCTTSYHISEQEYNRFLIIVNNSSESCIMVTGTSDVSGTEFNFLKEVIGEDEAVFKRNYAPITDLRSISYAYKIGDMI